MSTVAEAAAVRCSIRSKQLLLYYVRATKLYVNTYYYCLLYVWELWPQNVLKYDAYVAGESVRNTFETVRIEHDEI